MTDHSDQGRRSSIQDWQEDLEGEGGQEFSN